jgi:hypothetical protein
MSKPSCALIYRFRLKATATAWVMLGKVCPTTTSLKVALGNSQPMALANVLWEVGENGIVRGKAPCHLMLNVYQHTFMKDCNATEAGIIRVQPQRVDKVLHR